MAQPKKKTGQPESIGYLQKIDEHIDKIVTILNDAKKSSP